MVTLLLFMIGLMVFSCVLLVAYFVPKLQQEIPGEDRAYMDPLPPILRLLWPLIRFLEYHVCQFIPPDALEKTHRKLALTGVSYLISAEQFYAIRIISTFGGLLLVYLALAMLHKTSVGALAFGLLVGFYYPALWLSDVREKRRKAVLKTLPAYLDFITMAVEAGLNMTGAINQAMDKGPPGPLKHEFYMVVRDLRSGLPRADALRRMESRLQMKEITSMVGTVIQAEKMGASLGAALRVQAEQRRIERFQRAEKSAMEAPVKLIAPLMMFIFPVTFIVIGFPIVVKFLNSGAV